MAQTTNTLQGRITKKARELFYSEGTRAITMDYLADNLGISKRTLYQIYASKDELLKEILDQEYKNFTDFIDEQSKQYSSDAMQMMCNTMLYSKGLGERISKRFFDELEKFHPTLFYEYWTKFKTEYDKHALFFMRLVQEMGYIYPQINITIAHNVIDMMLQRMQELFRGGKYVEDELRESMIKPYMRGVFTAEGRRKLRKFDKKFNL